jgi:hypothetical protein
VRIVVAHDFFRSSALDAGDANAIGRFLHELIGPSLRRLGHTVSRASEVRGDGTSAVADIAARHGWQRGRESWIRAYSDPAAAGQVAQYYQPLGACDLVICWEMAPSLIRFLVDAGAGFIEIGIDSIRFCPDLFLRLRTNVPEIAARLAPQETAGEAVRIEAARLMAAISPVRLSKPHALFAAQMDLDTSLIVDGRLARAEPLLPAILAAKAGCSMLLKPHPYGAPHNDLRYLHRTLGDSVISDDNIYALLASPEIETVITLSSSVADEAGMFGKRAHRLIVPDNAPARFGDAVSRFFRIDARIGTAGFWSAVLPGASTPFSPASYPAEPAPRRLRDMFSYRWGHVDWPPAAKSRAITPGMRLPFGEGSAAASSCAFGWSAAESWGRWSDGDRATLLLSTAGIATAIRVRVTVNAFVPVPAEPLVVGLELRPEGRRWTIEFDGRGPSDIVFDVAAGADYSELTLAFGVLKSPAALGLSSDARALGLGLLAIEATPI